jgi:hypothetical protein
LLEAAGWRFFDEGGLRANIRLEFSVAIKIADLNALGENFEKTTRGSSTSFCLMPRASRSSSWKQRLRTRIRS